jgi:hypothetical protein
MPADYMLQKFMHNYQQEKQAANNYYSCAQQRTCGNASAPQKIIQATAEAGDANHAHRPSHVWRNCVADAPQDPNQHT